VKIVAALEKSVPPEVHDGLKTTLDLAANKTNAANKRAKFGFVTSEDAITWTVFRRLQLRGRLRETLYAVEMISSPAGAEPAMLLWGAPVPDHDPRAVTLCRSLAEVSAVIGEEESRRTEPDVALDLGDDGVVLVEVKHRSGNEVNDGGRWDRYLCDACFGDPRLARQTGLYELARNWRVAYDLSAGRPFTLVNLGPDRLFAAHELDTFRRSLGATGRGRFLTLSWQRLVETPDIHNDDVLRRFIEERGVVSSAPTSHARTP
jgi:hypothetical protein